MPPKQEHDRLPQMGITGLELVLAHPRKSLKIGNSTRRSTPYLAFCTQHLHSFIYQPLFACPTCFRSFSHLMRLLSLLLFASTALAITFPFQGQTVPYSHYTHQRRDALLPRATNASVSIRNNQNAVYISNITLGGRTIPVMLDTGR